MPSSINRSRANTKLGGNKNQSPAPPYTCISAIRENPTTSPNYDTWLYDK